MENLNNTPQWDRTKDKMLIEMVKVKPELYDLASPYYSDTVAKRRSWMEIGRQMGCGGSKCKERWESLRAQYRKQMNKVTKSEQAATNNIKWKYEDQMSFLRTLLKDRPRVTSVQQDDAEIIDHTEDNSPQQLCSEQVHEEKDEVCDVNVTISQQEPRTRKRKIHQNDTSASATLMRYLVEKKKEAQPTNPIDIFFSLMATTAKKFNPADQHYIKTKVFSLVSEVEAKYIQNQNVQTNKDGKRVIKEEEKEEERCGIGFKEEPFDEVNVQEEEEEELHFKEEPVDEMHEEDLHNGDESVCSSNQASTKRLRRKATQS